MAGTRYFQDYPASTGSQTLFKMEHYLETYDDLLSSWQGRNISFLEIGVYKGGSVPCGKASSGPMRG